MFHALADQPPVMLVHPVSLQSFGQFRYPLAQPALAQFGDLFNRDLFPRHQHAHHCLTGHPEDIADDVSDLDICGFQDLLYPILLSRQITLQLFSSAREVPQFDNAPGREKASFEHSVTVKMSQILSIAEIRLVSALRLLSPRGHEDNRDACFQNVLDRNPAGSRTFHRDAGAASSMSHFAMPQVPAQSLRTPVSLLLRPDRLDP